MDQPASDPTRSEYAISVTGELVAMGTQTLRRYHLRGLLEPARTERGTRRYSQADLTRLWRIGELLAAGLNLAGVGAVLELEAENAQLRAEKEDHPWLRTTPQPTQEIPETDLLKQHTPPAADQLSADFDSAPYRRAC